jgi:hypothetical protein
MYITMKFPKYSCSGCGKPSSRKWNLARHITNSHAGIGNCISNWGFDTCTYDTYWSKWANRAKGEKENSHYIRPELVRQFLSPGNELIERKPMLDYQRIITEEFLREIAKMIGSSFQATQTTMSPFSHKSSHWSPQPNSNVNTASDLQIFGYRGYVCNKCLISGTYYVGFPDAPGQGRLDGVHFCDPEKVSAAGELVDRFGWYRFLRNKIPLLIKQKVNSLTGQNNILVALKLSSPPEEIIKLRNIAHPEKPGIIFIYSKERHLILEPNKETKTKSNYLIRAIKDGTTLLKDDELTDFLEDIGNATFGIVGVHNKNTLKSEPAEKGDLYQDPLLSYFVYLGLAPL